MLSLEFESILLATDFAKGLAAIYLTKEYAVLYSGLTVLTNLPVDIFTGIFRIIFPATSLLLILAIPCPVRTTLLTLCFIPLFTISLFTNENISSILASIISISSELCFHL